jgi:hypothetical protein
MIYLLQHLAVVLSLALFHIVGPVPIDLGVHDGALAPCPSPAHCARADWPIQQGRGDAPQSALESLIPLRAIYTQPQPAPCLASSTI